jgi:NAD+ diphosphatase
MPTRRLNFYDHAVFDRAGVFRKDAAWIAARLDDEATRFVPVWRSQNLFVEEVPAPVLLERAELREIPGEFVLLGLDEGRAVFAVDLSPLETPLDAVRLDRPAQFGDLRRFGPLIDPGEGTLLAYARGMLYWHSRHRFCGVCGSPTGSVEAGHVRRCTNASCGTSHFPRTDPAVIMLVTDGDRCLLGRQRQWPAGMHSTLAGFVEPGESLERAVAREVIEETGIEVGEVTYHSSQPWPFPSSLMLGFTARALTTELRVDPEELETARWFDKAWLLRHEDDDEFRLPRRDSIARRLIEDWLGR